jgi:hypothetical protein
VALAEYCGVRIDSLAEGARYGEVMATFTKSDELQGAEFVDADLRGARFVRADLSGVVIRGVDVQAADIDAPWLLRRRELLARQRRRRDPTRRGRTQPPLSRPRRQARRRSRWTACGLGHARTHMAGDTRARRGDAGWHGRRFSRREWSFAQTLRQLVLATEAWLGRAINEIEQPFHPHRSNGPVAEVDGLDMSIFATVTPSYAEVALHCAASDLKVQVEVV